MKKIKSFLLPFCTLLLIIGGAFLPYASSALQDEQAGRVVEIRQFNPINLNLQTQTDIISVLQMMPQEYTWYTYNGPTNLSDDEAIRSAKASLQAISDSVMPLTLDSNAEIELEMGMAVLNADTNYSAILWVCNFDNSFIEDYTIFIDDNSGKMVKFVMIGTSASYEYIDEISDDNKQIAVTNNIDMDIYKWLRFCQEYYGVEILEMELDIDKEIWQYTVKYTCDNDDNVYIMPVNIANNIFVFN